MKHKIVLALLCLPLVGAAQSLTKGGIATQFNQWRAYGSTNLVAGANPLVPITPCAQTAGNANFFALSTGTPIKIVDPNNASIDEILTPTSIVAGSTCTATFTTVNAHTTPWYIVSGTFGLQEAINATTATGVLNAVTLDPPWFNSGGTASTMYNATGNANIALEVSSLKPSPTWRWSGTHYVPGFSALGTTNPTIAAGAAAGTSPTVSNNAASSGNVMTANVTTGTATTTGTLFTETVVTAAAGGNLNCVVQSVGANLGPAVTVTGTSATVATFTVAVAPTASTAYIYSVQCE